MKIIRNYIRKYHVSFDTVVEFEETIVADQPLIKVIRMNKCLSYASTIVYKIWSKLNEKHERKVAQKKSSIFNTDKIFVILMGPDFKQCLPVYIYPGDKNIFMFDAWPKNHQKIIKFVSEFKINNLFVTSLQVSKLLNSEFNNTKCHWIPEGISADKYKFFPYDEKNIDILSMGRQYERYHDEIVFFLKSTKRTYLFEKVKGQLIFPTRKEFIDGLAASKISICIPSNITHPERSNDIETMTIRYLQSMVSKCIVVGHAPKEMIKLFGYNPVIEIDWSNPTGQLESILSNYNEYIPMIEKNFNIVKQNHNWTRRWNQIEKILDKN